MSFEEKRVLPQPKMMMTARLAQTIRVSECLYEGIGRRRHRHTKALKPRRVCWMPRYVMRIFRSAGAHLPYASPWRIRGASCTARSAVAGEDGCHRT